jgi:dihydrolipoamide dehydrogenase
MKIVVIGAGPGGYEAAIKAAKLGAKVTVVEKNELGGTCLNRGCMPTKSLLASSEVLTTVNNAEKFGVYVDGEVNADFSGMIKRKDKLVSQLVKGIGFLFKKNGIEVVEGVGKLVEKNKIEVTSNEKKYWKQTELFLQPVQFLYVPEYLTMTVNMSSQVMKY